MDTHTLYVTTNNVNGKKYIGVRKINTTGHGGYYYGSGVVLNQAIKKYGKENFTRKDIIFGSKEDMYDAESTIVDEDVVDSDRFYNIKVGGYGGFHPSVYENQPCRKGRGLGRKLSDSHIESIKKAAYKRRGVKLSKNTVDLIIKNNYKAIPITIDGVEYSSRRQAAISLNLDPRTIKKRYAND